MEQKWMTAATAEIGQKEVKGRGDNPRILAYRRAARCSWMVGSEETVPWCAIFVNAMLEGAGIKGTGSPAAKSFCDSRSFIALHQPVPGCIVVIERDPPHPSLGHVGFCDGATAADVILLGGNQGDAVNRRSFSRKRVRGYYWPAAIPLPTSTSFASNVAAEKGDKVA